MPQGLRGRVALFGAGVVCCSGLVGCLTDSKAKGPPPVSKARAGAVTPAGAKTTTPDIRPVGGSGIPISGGFQTGVVPTGGYQPAAAPVPGYQPGSATPGYTGGIGGQTVPGVVGAGAPLPGSPPVVPSVSPPPSNYPPTNANYGSSNVGAMPTTARAAAPTQTAPPTPMLTEAPPLPPAPPGGILSPADTAPPIAPVGLNPPLAPTPPNAPR